MSNRPYLIQAYPRDGRPVPRVGDRFRAVSVEPGTDLHWGPCTNIELEILIMECGHPYSALYVADDFYEGDHLEPGAVCTCYCRECVPGTPSKQEEE
jgi:hypothetical protein